MKIAFVCPDDHSVTLFCKGIIRSLLSIDAAEVVVLCSISNYKQEIEKLGVRCISVDVYRYFNPVKDATYMIDLYKIFKKEKVDLVFNFSTKPNIYGTLAAKLAHVEKIIFHVVGLGSAFMASSSLKDKLIKSSYLFMYKLACNVAHNVWFTNKNDLAFFLSNQMIASDKTVLTRNYLNIDSYRPMPNDDVAIGNLRKELEVNYRDKVVVMVARMIWAKGIREFVEAAELLKKRCPIIKFILIAPLEPGSPDAVPEEYIREKEINANLKWLGFRDDVKSFYALSDIAVLPSYYKEGGYPRALLEPMAMGKPIIAADSDDCNATVDNGKNGYLVPIKDAKALADAIEHIVTDNEKCLEFGKYSRQKALTEFDENIIVPQAVKECGLIN